MANPVEQFIVRPIFGAEGMADGAVQGASSPLPFFTFTNSAAAMVAVVLVAGFFFVVATRKRAIVPGRWQSLGETIYEFIANMVRDNVGRQGMPYFPFVFTLFLFVFLGNMLGLLPYSFTFTSHLAVTVTLAAFIFLAVTVIGFVRHGVRYLRMFFPHGAPWVTAPILIPIELVSYLSRPFSLSVRLFANMTVGHIMLKVLAGFVVSMGFFGFLPFVVVAGVTVLEFVIAALQAYVFTILTCIYLNDAINMH